MLRQFVTDCRNSSMTSCPKFGRQLASFHIRMGFTAGTYACDVCERECTHERVCVRACLTSMSKHLDRIHCRCVRRARGCMCVCAGVGMAPLIGLLGG